MYLLVRFALADLQAAYESEHIDQPIGMCLSARPEWVTVRVEGVESHSFLITDAIETCRCLDMSHLINIAQTSCHSVQLSTTYQQTSLISDLSLPHNAADTWPYGHRHRSFPGKHCR